MGEDQRRRVVRQCPLNHLARVDAGTVYRALKQRLKRQHPVLGIEKQTTKHFVRLMAQQRFKVITHRLRTFQHRVAAQLLSQMPTAHFKHSLQLRKLRRPQAQMQAKYRLVRFKQAAQAAELAE
ncbi:hypothetical protein SAMN05216264_10359 [Pseudomonas marincola]|nr:hypothetical protein SAMN05216264_10359 [Pseudomonas marincola]